jgi:tetratricopeptide (TPR) repeat protein
MVLLVVLALCAAALYFGTRAFANNNRSMKTKDGRFWYQEGERQLRSGHPDLAVAAFRKGSVDDRNNRIYARALAQALEMDNRELEAQELLLQERETAPENPQINIELARIAAREHDTSEAVRYYHNALYGIWVGEEVDAQRQAIRRELIDFLIAQHAKDQALAEIFALAGRLPNTVAANADLGTLFLRAGDANRALENFRSVLRAQPHNQAVLEEAGQAAFMLGNYAQAHRYLEALAAPDPKAQSMLKVTSLAVANDPTEPRLSYAERKRRVSADFEHVSQLLQQCAAPQTPRQNGQPAPQANTLQPLLARQPDVAANLKAAGRQEEPDTIFRTLEFVYEVELAASRSCGPLSDLDSALLMVSQKSKGTEP